MTHTASLDAPAAPANSTTLLLPNPAELLMNLLVALLAPLFLAVAEGNPILARAAAAETIRAYCARNHADLIAVAQIIAFGLAAVSSISLSMDETLPLPMLLRLRNNANALHRSGQQHRAAIGLPTAAPRRAAANASEPAATEISVVGVAAPAINLEEQQRYEAATLMSLTAAQVLAAEAEARLRSPAEATGAAAPVPTASARAEPIAAPPAAAIATAAARDHLADAAIAAERKRHREQWGITMIKEASELARTIEHLPPAERRQASIQAAALTSAGTELLTGVPSLPPPPNTP